MKYTCIEFRTGSIEKYCWSKILKCFGCFHNFTKVVRLIMIFKRLEDLCEIFKRGVSFNFTKFWGKFYF